MENLVYYLDQPGGVFTPKTEIIPEPGFGEVRIRVRRTSVCQSDVVIYKVGLPRIKEWPAILLHEVSAEIEAVGEGVTKFEVGDLVGIGCDIPCGDRGCIYCGDHGTGDWTSCPNTQATGHEFPGFARSHAVLPDWFVELGPIVKFPKDFSPDHACQLEPLACCLEGMTRVNNCIENRVVVLIGAGSQSTYALQCAQAMGARKIIMINRGEERLNRVIKDFGGDNVVGLHWDDNVVERVFAECRPFNEPHFVMVNTPALPGYELAVQLMGYNTVLDGHAGVKGAGGKPCIAHEVDLNNDIHYKLQCYQATHGSNMHGIGLAHDLLANGKLTLIDRMTNATERFDHTQIMQAITRAADKDSLKVIIDWDNI
ncbi:zinc-dependent alcohol dehydrogenase [Rubellicoccus peritrichatus]|uniref:Alcohol dehydrogenase catalytic domain-containing protein n=1 Tax=Rubellicoccus peritrichatus TaxID=3080537 RepID=A0AAQ3LF31_9BACT|nr:alcohol dehydrogenase catalytic domain-containing protein [Puniceicoccus sp. CR14]WOO42745.1 alcohol dehydrogenase catalytic domain-containing protein [Puniceicoccus sp. CR14]